MSAPARGRMASFAQASASPFDALRSALTLNPVAMSCRVPPPSELICRVPTAAELDAMAAITEEKLHRIVGKRGPSKGLGDIAAALERHRRKAEINTPLRAAHFIAQVAHESQRFRRLTENLNYKPDQAKKVFPKRFNTEEDAKALLDADSTGEAFANHIYGNRKELGNNTDGDGYRYRGRGFIQLTGRANYAEAGKDIGIDLVADPDVVATIDVAAQTAFWFWKKRSINAKADIDSVEGVTGIINSAKEGLADRRQLLGVAKTTFFPRH